MRTSRNVVLALTFNACLSLASAQTPEILSPQQDVLIRQVLHAMDVDRTWSHPDIYWEYMGMHRYHHRDYAHAMSSFLRGAYYADKLSELCIGLMYLNGEGTPSDPAEAFAWLDVAAERGYPQFVATRDRVRASLTPEQVQRGSAVREQIASKYADSVAKPRMAQQLRFAIESITGSHLGFNPNLLGVSMHNACAPSEPQKMRLPEWGCSGIYSMYNLDPKTYFAERDSAWRATVTVEPIQPDADSPSITPAENRTTQHDRE
jgi:hypothetical protein